MTTSLVRPERSAHATIRGYLYQTCLGVVRWLDLADGEVLVVEGDEDLDRFLCEGVSVCEQVKAYTEKLNVRTRAVQESLRAFVVTFATLRQQGQDRRFVFTTTAERRHQRGGSFDVLVAWDDDERLGEVVSELRRILPRDDDKEFVANAFAWLDDEPVRWREFVRAVEWNFEAPDLDEVRRQIRDKLRDRGVQVIDEHIDRLIAELLRASSQADTEDRTRTRAGLETFLQSIDDDLLQWSASEPARRLRAVFDEVADIRRLLDDGTRLLPENPSPGQLLIASHEVVPFHEHGRCVELDDLAEWCSDEQRAGIWLWTGEGGVGKTRLMIEFCRRLRSQGWHAGFLKRELDTNFFDNLVEGQVPRLVVIDYAEARLDVIRPLAYRASTADSGPKCRIILLARCEADWWRILQEEDIDIETLVTNSQAPRELTFPGDPQSLMQEATAAFAAVREREYRSAIRPSKITEINRVLFLHMAALSAVDGEPISNVRSAPRKILEHEKRFWIRLIEANYDDKIQKRLLRRAVPRVLTALTLVGGVREKDIDSLLEAATTGLSLRNDVRDTMADILLMPLYGEQGHLRGLEPDILGEELVATYLAKDARLLDHILVAADDNGRMSALTILTRLARRHPEEEQWLARVFEGHLETLAEIALEVAIKTGDPAGLMLARYVGNMSKELIEQLVKRCDQKSYLRSVPLREVAYEVTRRSLAEKLTSPTESDPQQILELANIAMNAVVRLDDLGRRKDALEMAYATKNLLKNPMLISKGYISNLVARALVNLGYVLSNLGKREEALETTKAGVEYSRMLVAALPAKMLPYLACGLNNLSKMYVDLGRHREALAAAQESVAHHRVLAHSDFDTHMPELAGSLTSLGRILVETGMRSGAAEVMEEAVSYYRKLVSVRPDSYRSDLARGLMNLGAASDDEELALQVTKESVDIYRELSRKRPDAFLPDLARSLKSLGDALIGRDLGEALGHGGLGRQKEALAVTQEAVEIQRTLALSWPEAFSSDLSISLISVCTYLRELGQSEEALAAAEETVRFIGPIYEKTPGAVSNLVIAAIINYESAAKENGAEVDEVLMNPIRETMRRIKALEESKSDQ